MTMYNFNRGPRRAKGGIKARSESGDFARNWWAQRWLEAMEHLVAHLRLQRGQRYARLGQVLSIEETQGGVIARVQGSRPQPYKVTIRLAPLRDDQWDRVLDVMSTQAVFAAQLLAGEMPQKIEDAFEAAGVSLFPANEKDLITTCSCPDPANPCKHIAATHYILGDRFDDDPFLLFRLRGRTQEQILEGLRKRRGMNPRNRGRRKPTPAPAPAPETPVPSLLESMDHFWEGAAPLEGFSVTVHEPELPMPLLQRLGEPDFAGSLPLQDMLGEAYAVITRSALAMAYTGGEADFLIPPEEDFAPNQQA